MKFVLLSCSLSSPFPFSPLPLSPSAASLLKTFWGNLFYLAEFEWTVNQNTKVIVLDCLKKNPWNAKEMLSYGEITHTPVPTLADLEVADIMG